MTLLASCKFPESMAWVVSTFAGTGTAGSVDGYSTAQFKNPYGVAVDSSGYVYVADSDNHCIRKITPEGVVSTFAGSRTEGFKDGTGIEAQFNSPRGVVVNSSGNVVYVADTNNHRIRKITPADRIEDIVVSTLAGSGDADFADATGSTAQFHYPSDVAVDSSGNVYVADSNNNRIRKITPAGVVTTFAGTGTGSFAAGAGNAAKFNFPYGVTVDSSGDVVYVADRHNHRIRKITPADRIEDRVVSTLAGSGDAAFVDATGTTAKFKSPSGVAVDSSGNVYVADYGNHSIRKITPAGVVSTIAGNRWWGRRDGTGTAAQFDFPSDVAVDSSGNVVYVADRNNHRIRKIEYKKIEYKVP